VGNSAHSFCSNVSLAVQHCPVLLVLHVDS
jgi:hypothetical protein